jgi:hypothetical protein
MNSEDPLMRWIYMAMAAVAGAVTSLSGLAWRTMSWGEVFLTLFVGASFAIYVTPWLANLALGPQADMRTIAGLTYVAASGSNVLLPMLIRWVARMAGLEDKR